MDSFNYPDKVIFRRRLIEFIKANLNKSLIFISAPVGFGKTILLSQLADESEIPIIKLSPYPDDDIVAFIRKLLTLIEEAEPSAISGNAPDVSLLKRAIKTAETAEEATAETAVDSAYEYARSISRIISQIPKTAIIMDDFQNVKDRRLLKFIDVLLGNLPSQVTIIAASREALPDMLSRRILYGGSAYIGADRLQFSEEEVSEYTSASTRDNGGTADLLRAVAEKCEGWPVAVKYYLEKINAGMRYLHRLSAAEDSLLYNYVKYEMFDGFETEIKQFLLKTCFLDAFTAEFCDYVTESSDSKILLNTIEKLIPLIVRTSDEYSSFGGADTVFRYHRLYAEFLIAAALSGDDSAGRDSYGLSPYFYRRVYERAALYHYEHDNYTASAGYALDAGLRELGIRSTVKVCLDLLDKNDLAGANKLLENLNSMGGGAGAGLGGDVNYRFVTSVLLVRNGQYIESLKTLADVIEPLRARGNIQYYLIAVKARAVALRNAVSVESSLEFISFEDRFFTGISQRELFPIYALQIGNYLHLNMTGEAAELADRVYAAAVAEGDMITALSVNSFNIAIGFAAGDAEKAVALYAELKNISAEVERNMEHTWVGRSMAIHYLKIGNSRAAVEFVEKELESKKKNGIQEDISASYLLAAEVYLALGAGYREKGGEYLKLAYDHSMRNRQDKFYGSYVTLYRVMAAAGRDRLKPVHGKKISPPDAGLPDIDASEALSGVYRHLRLTTLSYAACIDVENGKYDQAVKKCEEGAETAALSRQNLLAWLFGGVACCAELLRAADAEGGEASGKKRRDALNRKIKDFLDVCEKESAAYLFQYYPLLNILLKYAVENGFSKEFASQSGLYAGVAYPKYNVRTLGEFNLYETNGSGEPIRFETFKSKELFAFFVANYDKSMNRNAILEKIWPDTKQANAVSHLHLSLHQLRKLFSSLSLDGLISFRDGFYKLDSDMLDIDIVRFAKRPDGNLKPDEQAGALEELCGLYNGLFMLDFGWDGLETIATHYEIMYTEYLMALKGIYEKKRNVIELRKINNKLKEISNQFI